MDDLRRQEGSEMISDQVVAQVAEAYKASPLLTGILLMNVMTFVGMGYYTIHVQEGAGAFIEKLEMQVLEMAKSCGNAGEKG